jgi:glycine cleavage system regulatory protein
LVEAPAALLDDLRRLESQGLRIVAQDVGAITPPAAGRRLTLEVVGNDRPGIVRDVTQVLAECGVNIEELTTDVTSGSFSGGTLFRAQALLLAPGGAAVDAVRARLERLGNEFMVDIKPVAE